MKKKKKRSKPGQQKMVRKNPGPPHGLRLHGLGKAHLGQCSLAPWQVSNILINLKKKNCPLFWISVGSIVFCIKNCVCCPRCLGSLAACISSSSTSWFFSSLRQNCTALRSLASTKTCNSMLHSATFLLRNIMSTAYLIWNHTMIPKKSDFLEESEKKPQHFACFSQASGFTCSVFTSAVIPETPPAAMVLIRVVFPAPLRPTTPYLRPLRRSRTASFRSM